MHLKRSLGLTAVTAGVVALLGVSIVLLVYGVMWLSFGAPARKGLGALLLLSAFVGFVFALWLATGRPPRWGTGESERHVRDEHRLLHIGRSPVGQRVPPVGPLGRKRRRRR